jgi:protein TonB
VGSDSPAQRGSHADPPGAASGRQVEQESLTAPVRILSKPRPRYPAQELELGRQGDVLIDVEFRYSGVLEVLGVRQGLSPRLNESALEAARKIRFLPARRDGRPVDTQATVRIRFQLAR